MGSGFSFLFISKRNAGGWQWLRTGIEDAAGFQDVCELRQDEEKE